jgi:hypothetical protein
LFFRCGGGDYITETERPNEEKQPLRNIYYKIRFARTKPNKKNIQEILIMTIKVFCSSKLISNTKNCKAREPKNIIINEKGEIFILQYLVALYFCYY